MLYVNDFLYVIVNQTGLRVYAYFYLRNCIIVTLDSAILYYVVYFGCLLVFFNKKGG